MACANNYINQSYKGLEIPAKRWKTLMLPYFSPIRLITIDSHCFSIFLPTMHLIIQLILTLVPKYLIKRKEHWKAFPLAVDQFQVNQFIWHSQISWNFTQRVFTQILPKGNNYAWFCHYCSGAILEKRIKAN